MSKFLSNLFNTKKNKLTITHDTQHHDIKVKHKKTTNNSENSDYSITSSDGPNLARKMSLTKSGRLKEKKRQNISVSEYFPSREKPHHLQDEDNRMYHRSASAGDSLRCDHSNVEDDDDDDVFTVEDVVNELRQIASVEIISRDTTS